MCVISIAAAAYIVKQNTKDKWMSQSQKKKTQQTFLYLQLAQITAFY